MNKILKKVVSIGILTSMICYTTPLFAFTKDETVYSKVDATGKNYKTIVSTRIDNKEGLQTINDLTNLLNIENTNGDETFTQDGKSIVWDAKGNDIYYQGESKEELPISVEIKYELDGVEVKPEEVAGKTGEVTIIVTYKNNDEHRVYVNGSYQTLYTPFCVVGGTIMNNNNKIQKVTNAKVINDGTKSIVVGIFFPGLQESLGVSKTTLEIPTQMKIKVDAKDFEMGQILTFATPKLMDEENTNLLNEVRNITSKIDLVQSSTTALKEGAEQLKNGTEEYNENAKLFNGKMQELSTGVSYMNSQYTQINDGISDIEAGTTKLKAGVATMAAKLPEAQAGLTAISTNLGKVNDSLDNVNTNLKTIIAGLGTVSATNNTATIQNLKAKIGANKVQIERLETENLTATDEQKAINNATIDILKDYNDDLQTAITALGATDVVTSATKIETFTNGLTAISNGIESENPETITLKNSITQIKAGVDTINTSVSQLDLTAFSKGVEGLSTGASELKAGSNTMKSKLIQLDTSTTKLSVANTQLTAASGQITEGAEKLSAGMTEFNTEIGKVLNSGISQVASRAQSLVKLSEEYTTFTETSKEINGRTKFIIMTDKLRKED